MILLLHSKGLSGTGAFPGYTVNALMENRHRILLGFGTEIFRSVASETSGCLALLRRAKRRVGFTFATLGADKDFFSVRFIEALRDRGIAPHIAVDERGRQPAHARVRMRAGGLGYRLSQRARKKKIEELFDEGKTATNCGGSDGAGWIACGRTRTSLAGVSISSGWPRLLDPDVQPT